MSRQDEYQMSERKSSKPGNVRAVASLEGGQGGQLTPLEFWKIP